MTEAFLFIVMLMLAFQMGVLVHRIYVFHERSAYNKAVLKLLSSLEKELKRSKAKKKIT